LDQPVAGIILFQSAAYFLWHEISICQCHFIIFELRHIVRGFIGYHFVVISPAFLMRQKHIIFQAFINSHDRCRQKSVVPIQFQSLLVYLDFPNIQGVSKRALQIESI
jgi:hypothetical protein